MEKLNIWSESREVRFGVIDKSDLMTLDAVMDFFQEAAISHAENLGVGREAMARARQGWILSRLSVEIHRRPQYGEAVTVRTWPRGVEKLFALRDFDIRDASGNPAVQARSCWLVIDIEKRRPLRPQSVMDSIPQNEGQDALPFAASLEERPYLQQVAERQALYTDVDYNSHVNNVSYIRWIEDALDPALLEKAQRMRLDINYLSEILPGEVTGIRAAEIETAAASAVPVASPVAVLPPSHAFAFDGKKDQPPDNPFAFRAELRLWH